MTTKERIEKLLDYLNMGPVVLANKAGIARTQIADIKNGRVQKISYNTADAICRIFPTVNRDWLLTGEGEMLVQEPPKEPTLEDSLLKIVNAQLATNALLQEEITELKAQNNKMQAQSEAMHREFMVAVKVLNQLGARLNIPNDYQLASEPKPGNAPKTTKG